MLLVSRIFALAFVSHAPDPYLIVDEQMTTVDGLKRTTWTVEVGGNPNNRFTIYRVRERASREAIILAPPLASGFQNYEISDNGDYDRSFAAFFANHGIEVWGFSQRVNHLAPGDCESGAVDCSYLSELGLESLVDDADFVRRKLMNTHPARKKPAIGGLSLGTIIAYAAVNRSPRAYAGVIDLDGGLFDDDPAARAITTNSCLLLEGLLAAGVYFDPSVQGFKQLAQLALADPNGPSPVPGFPPGLTNKQVFILVLSTPVPGPTSPRPNFTLARGNFVTATLDYSDFDYIARSAAEGFINYTPTRTVRDINCSLAALDDTWYNNLSAYRGEIFVHASGFGFSEANTDTAALAPQADTRTLFFDDFGHVDGFFARFHRLELELPLLIWLKTQVF